MWNRIGKNILTLMFTALALFFIACSDNDSDSDNALSEIRIGVLAPLTGEYATGGAMMVPALELAVEDLAIEYENKTITLETGDTETTADGAIDLFSTFVADGINLMIGPMTSSELLAISELSSASYAVILSPSSTSPSISADDQIFRLVPGDSSLAAAIAAAMWYKEIRYLCSIYRDDTWGNSLSALVQEAFVAKGGTVLSSFAYSNLRRSIAEEILDSVNTVMENNSDKLSETAIQLSSYNEGQLYLEVASEKELLDDVAWFGSDGLVQDASLFDNATASAFAAQVGFNSPIYAVQSTAETEGFAASFETATGSEPDTYAMVAYDALILAVRGCITAGKSATPAEIATAITSEAESMSGITGALSLDGNGDRDTAKYYFWSVVEEGGTYSWSHSMTYIDGTITE